VGAQLRLRDALLVANVRYPGIPAVVDGSEAVAYVETRISEGACTYPITPSTTMAALYQAGVADGKATSGPPDCGSSSWNPSTPPRQPPKASRWPAAA
jgi:hypothetical protein